MRTPWGAVQTQRTLAEGIIQVSTAGHGGFVVSDSRLKAMPAKYKVNVYGRGRYFEEDCEWALVVLAFPSEFSEEIQQAAHDTARCYYPQLIQTEGLAIAS